MKNENVTKRNKVLTIIGTILCLILTPILIMNLTLIAKSYLHTDKVPSLAGYFPMIVLTDSMYPEIESGDLIICRNVDAENVKTGNVITFFDPMGNGKTVVTHRVMEITESNGKFSFITKGDNNNALDSVPVSDAALIGMYQFRIPGAGNAAMFMQTTPGLIVCVGCPMIIMIAWDALRRKKYENEKQKDTEALLAELEALRSMKAERDQMNL